MHKIEKYPVSMETTEKMIHNLVWCFYDMRLSFIVGFSVYILILEIIPIP